VLVAGKLITGPCDSRGEVPPHSSLSKELVWILYPEYIKIPYEPQLDWRSKITVVWDVMPSHLVESYQSFGGTCCLHLQGTIKWRQQVPPKRWHRSTRLGGVTSKNTVIFIFTAMRTSDLTWNDFRRGNVRIIAIRKLDLFFLFFYFISNQKLHFYKLICWLKSCDAL
jgi:hypothetical protein